MADAVVDPKSRTSTTPAADKPTLRTDQTGGKYIITKEAIATRSFGEQLGRIRVFFNARNAAR